VLEVTTGQTLIETIQRNNAATFTAFLDRLDRLLPRDKDIHAVLDNGSSHTVRHTRTWLAAHPRRHVHWTPPHASWLSQAELVLSALTRAVLRNGDFTRPRRPDREDGHLDHPTQRTRPPLPLDLPRHPAQGSDLNPPPTCAEQH
jgi:transposase